MAVFALQGQNLVFETDSTGFYLTHKGQNTHYVTLYFEMFAHTALTFCSCSGTAVFVFNLLQNFDGCWIGKYRTMKHFSPGVVV